MPSKGKGLKYGKRYNPINETFYKKFIDETGINIDYKTFSEIIRTTNGMIKDAIIEEAGVKLPENLGHIIVTKYKSNRMPWDWQNTKKYNMKVPLTNLHSLGYIHHIKWFKIGVRFSNSYIYKFHFYRELKRDLAKAIKSGKQYFSWSNSDLWSSTKMERRFEKMFKKTNKCL